MLARTPFYRRLLVNATAEYATIVVFASFGLVVGIIMVLVHNFWIFEHLHILIVTIIGWLILINSILWLAIPDTMAVYSKRACGGWGYYVIIVIMAIVGVILLTKGFYLFDPDFNF
ncbi:hypothetical protein [Legionella lansingensis]|nr:hypothetical protein [Legionella lansingensis]